MFQRPNREIVNLEDEGGTYWISFSDLMSGILILFVLASLALVVELSRTRIEVNAAISQVAGIESIKANLLEELQVDLANQGIAVEITDNKSVMRIPDTTLAFATNRASLSPALEQVATQIGHTLFQAITRNDRWKILDTILVEGHCDKRATAKDRGNKGLATDRANEIIRLWEKKLPKNEQLGSLKNLKNEFLLGASGYGATRPIQIEQKTEEDYRKNRRIDIRFMTRTPALEEYKQITKRLEMHSVPK